MIVLCKLHGGCEYGDPALMPEPGEGAGPQE